MNSKIKILIGVLVVGIVLIGWWWIWNLQKQSQVKEFCTSNLLEDCYGKRVKVIGTFIGLTKGCNAGIIVGEKGEETVFLPEFAGKCEMIKQYQDKKVEVVGVIEKHFCPPETQCWGEMVINHIESIKILESQTQVTLKEIEMQPWNFNNKIVEIDVKSFSFEGPAVKTLALICGRYNYTSIISDGSSETFLCIPENLTLTPPVKIKAKVIATTKCKKFNDNPLTQMIECGEYYPLTSRNPKHWTFKLQFIEVIKEKQVTITTDKTEYEQGEAVKFTVKNNLNQKIVLIAHDLMVKKLEENEWKMIRRWGVCCGRCRPIMSYNIYPNSVKQFTWDQKTFACEIFGEIPKQVPAGKYRIEGKYFINGEWKNVKTIYSNEFIIK